jgi:hypothetical protein
MCKKIASLPQKKMKLWRLFKIEDSVLIYTILSLGSTYTGEKKTTFVKAHGLEMRCSYEEHVGEHFKNPLRTQMEHHGNTLRNKKN